MKVELILHTHTYTHTHFYGLTFKIFKKLSLSSYKNIFSFRQVCTQANLKLIIGHAVIEFYFSNVLLILSFGK